MVIDQPVSCRCTKPGRTAGRAACCGGQNSWSKKLNEDWDEHKPFTANWIKNNGGKVRSESNLPTEQHKHEYCHVHKENRDRTVKKTEWREMPFNYTKMVLKPFKKTVKKTVLVKRKQLTSKIEYETKTIKKRKTIMKTVTRKKIKTVMKKVTRQEA